MSLLYRFMYNFLKRFLKPSPLNAYGVAPATWKGSVRTNEIALATAKLKKLKEQGVGVVGIQRVIAPHEQVLLQHRVARFFPRLIVTDISF